MLKLSDFQALFPSSDIQNLDATKDKKYIIYTLIKNSTLDGWKWMLDEYKREDIAEVIKLSKDLKPREVYFWSYFLGIPKSEIICLNKDLPKTPKTSWEY
ncbi:MAG: hypothetical protein ACD_22C00238G0007 [uncultured bacterium]|nr:MAG: hypothetical protein ACD_22C00238G0007 [uncultured bacterium]